MNILLNNQVVSYNFLRWKIILHKFKELQAGNISFEKIIRYILASISPKNSNNLFKSFWRCKGAYIGKKVYLNQSAVLDGVRPDLIFIGSNTILGGRTAIITHNPGGNSNKVVIGSNCFISYGSIILPGVGMDDNCIVGAGSVVTSRVFSSGLVIGGNPAKILNE